MSILLEPKFRLRIYNLFISWTLIATNFTPSDFKLFLTKFSFRDIRFLIDFIFSVTLFAP